MADRLTAEPPSLSRAERPNTVFGLLDKRAELVKLQQQLETDLRKVICDIDHLDAAIGGFRNEAQRVKQSGFGRLCQAPRVAPGAG
jgi:hypothetical protein